MDDGGATLYTVLEDGWMEDGEWRVEDGGVGLDDNDFLLRFDSGFCIPAYIIS